MTKQNKSNGIINFYERLPKHLREEVYNPNYDLHMIKIPFRMVVVAPSGSGKTNFVVNLIAEFSKKKRGRKKQGTFSDIHIITRNKDEKLYNLLEEKSPSIIIEEGVENIPNLDEFDKETNHLVVFDDLVLEKDLTEICEYYIRARKLNVSVIFLSQSYYQIPKIIRGNSNYIVILKLHGKKDINLILSEYSLGVSSDQIFDIYKYATDKKFSPLIIDLDTDNHNQMFRKGFDEFIDPEEYKEKEKPKPVKRTSNIIIH